MTDPAIPTHVFCTEIAGLHRALATMYERLADQMRTAEQPADAAKAADAPRRGRPPKAEAKKDEAPKAEAEKAEAQKAEAAKDEAPEAEVKKAEEPNRAKEAQLVDTRPTLTPEQIAARLRESIVALSAKDRATCLAIVASYGARKFSEIPVAKHAEALAEMIAALDKAGKKAEDPLA